ncbi:MAG: DUF169 domain-containing protein [Thermodesulfobacteriota bacterium]
MTYQEMQRMLMEELRLYHYPIAVKFFFDQSRVDAFKEKADEYHSPVKPLTFCQWEIAARMQGRIVYGEKKHLGCGNAQYNFGWKELDEGEIKGQAKYTKSLEQAERFIRTKARMTEGLIGIAVAPLAKADVFGGPDTVHFYCDNMQAYHLAVDYMAATDTHPLRGNITMNSSACGGNIWSFLNREFNMLPSCSGAYNAGKTERGEINVIIPGSAIAAVCLRLKERIDECGSGAITRPGDGFPGADICKNCPLIVFKKEPGKEA